ncbi:hypothetical protein Golob_018153 [Gossypium lobatum]|uniref:Uncharacterized protein n=1 Tax=Gossypium lobatum TaxID=34289 RepID=A0A7J8M9R2_9ROSI|nr:hypothetical protein [Gossypium lobatum]
MEKSFVFLVFSCMLIKLGHVVPQAEATRAFFEFRDSLIDNGNNNYLATTEEADALPL